MKNKWIFVTVFLITMFLSVSILAGFISLFAEEPVTGNVAIIPIKGAIMPGSGSVFGTEGVSSDNVITKIEKANEQPNIKAIILEINSPGGTPVASEEIADAVKSSDKLTVAYIREVGASGAFWVASAADHVIANRMSIIGSIGVIASYLEFSGLIRDYNVTYQRLVSGEYKDMGSPFKRLTGEEERILQKQINIIHDYFVNDVAANRNMSIEDVKRIATGEFFLGQEGVDLGFIDELGGRDEAIVYIERSLNITADTFEMTDRVGLLDIFSSMINENSFMVGKGIGSSLTEKSYSIWT